MEGKRSFFLILVVVAVIVFLTIAVSSRNKPNGLIENFTAELTKLLRPALPSSTRSNQAWATYKNTRYNYQLNYPQEYILRSVEHGSEPSVSGAVDIDSTCDSRNCDPNLTVTISSYMPANYKPDNSLEEYYTKIDPAYNTILSEEHITVGGEKALARVVSGLEVASYLNKGVRYYENDYEVVVLHNKTAYDFSFTETGTNLSSAKTIGDFQSKNIINQILSSFTFTD